MNKRQSIKVLRRIVMGSILTLGYSACSPSHPDVAGLGNRQRSVE